MTGEVGLRKARHALRSRRLATSRRGAYFFVIDAFLAASILAFTLILIFSLFLNQRESEQSFTYAHDYLSFLTSTQARDYRNPVVTGMIQEGHIRDPRLTLAALVLLFHNESKHENVTSILDSTVATLPLDLILNVTIHDSSTGERTSLYSRGAPDPERHTQHLSAKALQHVIVGENRLYGPLILEVEVWT